MKKITTVIAGGIVGGMMGVLLMKQNMQKIVREKEKKINKYKQYYDTLNYWMETKTSGKEFMNYFQKNNVKNIVIYGMGELGSRLYEQLEGEDINIFYAIDRNPVSSYANLDVVGEARGEAEKVDLVIVTPIFDFDNIRDELQKYFSCEIISLEDIIYSM